MPRPANFARFLPASDRSLLVSLGEEISLENNQRIANFLRLLEAEPIPGIHNLHPSYCSLLITFDAMRLEHNGLQTILQGYLVQLEHLPLPEPRLATATSLY